MIFSQDFLKAAHKHSGPNREEVMASVVCGCFYCKSTFAPSAIDMWVNDEAFATCPTCSIDSVIGEKSGYPGTDPQFLADMHHFWFEN